MSDVQPLTDEELAMGEIWRCSCCGELKTEITDPSWRWNGEAWEHSHGQAGHFAARNFESAVMGMPIEGYPMAANCDTGEEIDSTEEEPSKDWQIGHLSACVEAYKHRLAESEQARQEAERERDQYKQAYADALALLERWQTNLEKALSDE